VVVGRYNLIAPPGLDPKTNFATETDYRQIMEMLEGEKAGTKHEHLVLHKITKPPWMPFWAVPIKFIMTLLLLSCIR
jgi:hypothetical protein